MPDSPNSHTPILPPSHPSLDYSGCAFPVEGLGPGRRVAIWVRGCRQRCPGCISPELWQSGDPTPIAAVTEELLPLLASADGLTISGGEPFDQAEELCQLLDTLRQIQDVEALVFSGYRYEELAAREGAVARLLNLIDILIDGPFDQEAPNTLCWRGSDNQRVRLLSARAQRYAELIDQPMPAQRPLQVQMLSATRYRLIGIPRRGDLEVYRAAMAARGFEVKSEYE